MYPYLIDFSMIDEYQVRVEEVLPNGYLKVKKVGGLLPSFMRKRTYWRVGYSYIRLLSLEGKVIGQPNFASYVVQRCQDLLIGKEVTLKYTKFHSSKYLFAEVWLGEQFVNLYLINEGLALLRPRGKASSTHIRRALVRGQFTSMVQHKGVWSYEGVEF